MRDKTSWYRSILPNDEENEIWIFFLAAEENENWNDACREEMENDAQVWKIKKLNN